MASSSNSFPASALVTLPKKRNNYDVFVTFRGEDTRNNFTDFLFNALEDKGVCVFRDDTNLPKGDTIGPELLCAIEASQVFVVIFSKNYASSTWCLQELEKICECVQVSGKHVLPVFYDVDPSEVRKQSGIYGEAFVKHEQRFQQDYEISMVQRWRKDLTQAFVKHETRFQQDYEKVQRWRKALTQVGSISGWDVRHKSHSSQIKEIVQRILDILPFKSSCDSKYLVGMKSPIQELENHLSLDSVDDVRAVGIRGMGGIGKTTLATALYDRVSNQFGACCFINDVSKVYRSHDGPLGVQKLILRKTVGKIQNQICNSHDAINLMQHRLGGVRTLLILDNIDHVKQLEIIPVSREWLCPGSRIIMTSRDEHILKKYGVDVVYNIPLLNKTNSLELFCRQAFKLDHILNSYEGLVSSILHYTNGLPLANEVLGSFLYGRNISEWGSALSRLRESPNKDVMDVLQISFDGLDKEEKEIFLHIACFFNDAGEYYVKNILKCCGFHADIGLRILIDKSLIRIESGMIIMHNLLEELGRKIVQESSNEESTKWKRLWLKEQFHDVMSDLMEKNVEAIVLQSYFGKKEEEEEMMKDAVMIEYFSNLKLLIIWRMGGYVNSYESLSCLSNELRYLEWLEYPFMYLPSSFQPIQLVELILLESSIKQLWKGKKYLPNLRHLCLRDCYNLIEIPNFEEFPNLEKLNLEGCERLVKLDPSIGRLSKLVYLNLQYCSSLKGLPTNTIFQMRSLEYINMRDCSKLSFNNPRASHSLQSTSPSSNVPQHRIIIAHSFSSREEWLYSLNEIDISNCDLRQLPDAIGCLSQLQSLNLEGNYFVSLPSLNELFKLVYLNLSHCKLLESLPQLPFPTAVNWDLPIDNIGLHTYGCPKLGERELRIAFSWMTQLIQANPQFSREIEITVPGSEIPSWFMNQIVGGRILFVQSVGGRIRVDNSPIKHDINNDIIGLLCCSLQFNSIEITYVPRKWSQYVPGLNRGTYDIKFMYPPWVTHEKICGYGWVHKQDLQEFNFMYPGNSSALKRKFLAIEDIHSSD